LIPVAVSLDKQLCEASEIVVLLIGEHHIR
jgi:hypothetical protein